jgi:hypothetical protein
MNSVRASSFDYEVEFIGLFFRWTGGCRLVLVRYSRRYEYWFNLKSFPNRILGSCMCFTLGCSIAEIISAYPTSGGLYMGTREI